MQSNLPKTATLGTRKGGYCGGVAVMRRWGCNMTIFGRGEQHVMLVSPNKNIVINAPYGSNFLTIPDLFVSHWKNWPLWRGFFGSWGCSAVDVAVVERYKLEPMYRLSAGQKKSGYCREVAVSGLVWLYIPFIFSSKFFAINDFPREGRLIISKVINRLFKILNCKLSLISHLKSVIPILTG